MSALVEPVDTSVPYLAAPPAAPPRVETSELGATFAGRRYVLLVLMLGSLFALGPLTIDAYLPALPTITTELGATNAQTQLTLTGLLLGLGLGQLVIGPWSDSVGRRRPLLVGLVAHAAMSVLCALAPSIGMLTTTRVLQGVSGAAVAVVVMAMVRDLFTGHRAAELLSRLILVLGLAPILAPSLGSALLEFTSWRGIFVFLAAAALSLLLVTAWKLPETLPAERRRPAKVQATVRAYRDVLGDGSFVGLILVASLVFAALFGYVAGSPFVLQEVFGLSTGAFGVAFAVNAAGMILVTQLNPMLVRRWGPARILMTGVVVSLTACVALVVTAATGLGGLAGFVVPMSVVFVGFGLTLPNAPALALSRHGEAAGTAAAVLGAAQFGIGGLSSPLVGVFANGTAVPLAVIMAVAVGLAAGILLVLRRGLIAQLVD